MLFLTETILAAAGFRRDQNRDTWVVPAVLRPVVTVDCGGLCVMDALLQVHDVLEAWGCTYNNFAIRGRYLSLVGLAKAQ
jgi:hypothetical protein